ncbi:MAG: type II secretion system F family protein [Thermodesulfobacteriota bacterium]|nr:type II secretion system F family protein [Thermodesulfobacteriota bacterium]
MNISAEHMPIIVSGTAFLFMLLVIAGIVLYMRYGKKKQALIQKIRKEGKNTDKAYPAESSYHTGGWVQTRVLGFLSSLGQKVPTKEKAVNYSKLRPLFLKAGLRHENTPAVFMGAKVLLAVLLPLCVLLVRIVFPGFMLPGKQLTALSVALAIAGFYLPNLWLRLKISRRRDTILKGFPDALDLMVVCVEAGMGLDSAITRVAGEIELNNKILSDELKLYNLEMRAGKLRKDALKNLAMRTDVEEVNNLVTLLLQTEKFGTSVGQALTVYSDTMRIQRFQRAEEMAAKLPTKLLFPLIFFIFPSLFVVLMGPAAITIVKTFKRF